jgi:hypothetical protein
MIAYSPTITWKAHQDQHARREGDDTARGSGD